eukprot:ANDGO_02728.mRNA.1 hypothetical protein
MVDFGLFVRCAAAVSFVGGMGYLTVHSETSDRAHLEYILEHPDEWSRVYRENVAKIQDRKIAFAKKLGNRFGFSAPET